MHICELPLDNAWRCFRANLSTPSQPSASTISKRKLVGSVPYPSTSRDAGYAKIAENHVENAVRGSPKARDERGEKIRQNVTADRCVDQLQKIMHIRPSYCIRSSQSSCNYLTVSNHHCTNSTSCGQTSSFLLCLQLSGRHSPLLLQRVLATSPVYISM